MSTAISEPAVSQPICKNCGDPAHAPGESYRSNCGEDERIVRSPLAMVMDNRGISYRARMPGAAFRVKVANTQYRTS